MWGLDKCDSTRGKNQSNCSFVCLILKWSVQHSSHTEYCRLAGTQTVLGRGRVISSVCDTIHGWCLTKEGVPECKQHSRWAWPLVTRIGWTPCDRRGQQHWNIIATAANHPAFPMKSLFGKAKSVSQLQTDSSSFFAKGKMKKKNTMTAQKDKGVTLTWAHPVL